jgi:hypothetical protein
MFSTGVFAVSSPAKRPLTLSYTPSVGPARSSEDRRHLGQSVQGCHEVTCLII